MESVKAWVEQGPLWAAQVLDLLTAEREYRRVERACDDRQRDRILNRSNRDEKSVQHHPTPRGEDDQFLAVAAQHPEHGRAQAEHAAACAAQDPRRSLCVVRQNQVVLT